MTEPPTLTIAVCTFNRAPLLARMLASIRRQSRQDFDVIILDDCSTDGTRALCEPLVGERLRYVRNPTNLGFNANYNQALTLATSSYVLLTHDDDYMDPDFVAYLLSGVARHPDAVLVTTNVRLVDETDGHSLVFPAPLAGVQADKAARSPIALKLANDAIFGPGEFWSAHYDGRTSLFCPTFCFARQRTIDAKIAFEPIGPGSDTLIGLRVNLSGIVVVLAEAHFNVCIHSGQDHTSVINDLTAGYRLDRVAAPLLAATPRLAPYHEALTFNLTYHFAKAAAATLLGMRSPLSPDVDGTPEERYARLCATIPVGFVPAVFSSGRNRVAARLFAHEHLLASIPRIDAEDWVQRMPQLTPHLRRWHLANFSTLDRLDDLLAIPDRLAAACPHFLRNRTIVVWGASYLGLIIVEVLRRLQIPIAGLVDRNPRMHGGRYRDLVCRGWPETLETIAPVRGELLILTGVEGALDVEIALDLLPYRKDIPRFLVRSWRTAIDLIEEAASHVPHV